MQVWRSLCTECLAQLQEDEHTGQGPGTVIDEGDFLVLSYQSLVKKKRGGAGRKEA